MGNYFKPLRRKFGVVTLLVACLFAAAWVRGLTTADQFAARISKDALFWMISNNGWFGCVVVLEPKVGAENGSFQHWTDPNSSADRSQGPFDGAPYNWDWESYPNLILPNSTIVIPLTLLSIWLLLSKTSSFVPKSNSKA